MRENDGKKTQKKGSLVIPDQMLKGFMQFSRFY